MEISYDTKWEASIHQKTRVSPILYQQSGPRGSHPAVRHDRSQQHCRTYRNAARRTAPAIPSPMSIHLPKTRRDLTLLSTSELTRLLDIPESRMLKALREGAVRPLGTVGGVKLIGL